MNVKLGKIKPSEAMDLIDELEKKFEAVSQNTHLPYKPDFDIINNMVIDIYRSHLKCQ